MQMYNYLTDYPIFILQNGVFLTLYSMIMPFDAFEIYYVFENIMEYGAFAP